MSVEDFEVPIVQEGSGRLPLFLPHVPRRASEAVARTLESRWIGQGPQVDQFENLFSKRFGGYESLAVGSGTDALHLAYLLAGLGPGDEVLTPLFTCTATNIPLLYVGATPIFVDVDPKTLNLNVEDARRRATEKTKAIVVVHYGGLPCDMEAIHDLGRELNVPVIEDAAHALGAEYRGVPVGALSDFTMFSFQAIKHITTADGGMLTLKDGGKRPRAERLRWFGIDRSKKQGGIWENDIEDVGFKYQMTDLAASIGIEGLSELDWILGKRRQLYARYLELLLPIKGVEVLGHPNEESLHAAWLMTILVEERVELQRKLLDAGIEANQVHYRNDRYSIFGGRRDDYPMMDAVEAGYLVLPLHTRMNEADVDRVCAVIADGW